MAYRLPLTAYRLPLTAYRLPLTAYRLPLTAYRLPLTALFCFSLMGCQAINDTLSSVNSALSTINDTLSTNGRTLSSTNKSSILSSLNKASSPSNTSKLFNDAKPTLETVLGLIACEKDNQLKAYTDESSVGLSTPLSPIRSMAHHKSGCLNVQRIDAIKKKSANAFSFRVLYISPQSQESQTGRYTAIKQPSGEWLFNWSPISAL